MNAPWRTLTHSPMFEAQCATFEPDARRYDELLRGVTNVVARAPERGKPTSVPGVLWLPADLNDHHGLGLFYRIEEDGSVTLLGIYPRDTIEAWWEGRGGDAA